MMKTKYLSFLLLLPAAVMAVSCSDDDDYTVATGNIITEVTTGDAAVTAVSATTSGTVKDLSGQDASSYEVGVVYSESSNPAADGNKKAGSVGADGTVTTAITGLEKGKTYYYATYVTLQKKVTKYGDVKQFVTTDVSISTLDAQSVTAVTATVGGKVSQGSDVISGSDKIECGIKLFWNEEKVASEGYDYPLDGSNTTFTVSLKGLNPGQEYYYVPYYKISDGYQYGQVKSFTTKSQEMEFVDLGLGKLWAKWNLGASKETEVGGLFGWADPTGTICSDYLPDYAPAEDISGLNVDPAAVGAIDNSDLEETYNSHLPSLADVEELLAGTTQKWETVGGVAGMRFTSKKNGNSIFLPAAGYRESTVPNGSAVLGDYWTGSVKSTNNAYGNTLSFTSAGANAGFAKRSVAMSVRPVKASNRLACDNSKLVVGDLEGNGRIRIEIYNEYGQTKADSPVNVSALKFANSMKITFTLSGIDGNLKAGSPSSFNAGIEYADADWSPSYWSTLDGTNAWDTVVKGDGTYTVSMQTGGAAAEGAMVFCIDIANLGSSLADMAKLKATINSIELDAE